MSTDYDATIVAGFIFEFPTFFRAHLREDKEVSHMEKRFDPKKGTALPDVKVIDRESGWNIVIPNKKGKEEVFEGPHPDEAKEDTWEWFPDNDLCEALARLLDARVSVSGNHEEGSFWLCIEPSQKKLQMKNGGYLMSDLRKVNKDLYRIAKALEKHGFPTDVPTVYALAEVG